MIGRHLAHYEILEKLGQGGMGEVYRAHDSKLGRDVALKILPEATARDPERRARFLREARSVAALKHPNIVTIHSVEEIDGIPFITMELVEGHSLAFMIPPDGLRLDHFFNYAVPLADAISFAHERGITHRDLKPANIMIDHDHRVKVLDFGLAKVFATAQSMDTAETVARTHDTADGRILGTPAYMSPEQAEGKPIDHRSDIFSLGIVLYEMTTGVRPFQGDTPISTISSILKDQPKSVSDLKAANPRELGRIIAHCLEKDPERRFQSAKDVRNQLEDVRRELDSGEIAGGGTSGIRRAESAPGNESRRGPVFSRPVAIIGVVIGFAVAAFFLVGRQRSAIPPQVPGSAAVPAVNRDRQMAVVLPFENLGPAEDAYFAAGVTEEITSRLASVSGLGVISRTSAESYSKTGKNVRQIGDELDVDYVLEGSVRWAKSESGKGRVRITPTLIRVSDDTPVWSESYDREVSDIFDVQTDIATHVVDALGVTLHASEKARLEEHPTSNMEAYQLYLRAMDLVCNDLGACEDKLMNLLEEALRLDPNFLLAWSEVARHHAFLYHANIDRTEARLARAKTALERMEAIDPAHPLTRLTRGFYYYHGYRDYDRALAEFEAAATARPNDAEAILAVALIQRRKGDLDESVMRMERALELDPKNGQYLFELADTYDAVRQPDKALEYFGRSYASRKDPTVLSEMAMTTLRFHGDIKSARRILAGADDPNSDALLPARTFACLLERDYDGALAVLRGANIPMPTVRAGIAAWIGIIETQGRGLESGRPHLEEGARQLEAVLREAPGDYMARGYLAGVYAYLGRKEDAIREARLAVDVIAKDAYAGPVALSSLAAVYANTGKSEEAMELIERLLGMNYEDPVTVTMLRLDPVWDPLRDNQRFKELLKRSS